MFNLFIDDERFPSEKSDKEFTIERSSAEAISLMKDQGCPDFISFDHDLGGEDTAMIVVKWMIETDIDSMPTQFIPRHFEFAVHSQNPIGAKNILEMLNSYLRFRKENGNIRV